MSDWLAWVLHDLLVIAGDRSMLAGSDQRSIPCSNVYHVEATLMLPAGVKPVALSCNLSFEVDCLRNWRSHLSGWLAIAGPVLSP